MAGRKTVYNNITSPEKLAQCNKNNIELGEEFLDYLRSVDRAETTIKQYESDLKIFWCWNYEYNKNKDFIKITKREFSKMQNHCLNVWGWSPKRVRRFKSTISSMSNFIENILDEEEEFEGYRSSIKKIESPVNTTVREKTIFETEEIETLLQILIDNKQYMKACVVALCAFSGRRKSEIPRFKVSYFDEENVKFSGAMYKTPEKVRTKGHGKGKYLELYVLKKPFDPYLKLWLEERGRLGITSEWLFPRKENGKWVDEPLKTDTMDNWVDGFSKILGKPFYYHSMRHLFTTNLAKNSIPATVIQEIIGWESIDMVNLYSDISADESIGKYFDENGIKQVEQKSLNDI